jgi:hypothetical protein
MEHRTMNIEHRTPNAGMAFGHFIRYSAFDIQRSMFPVSSLGQAQ